MYRYLQSDFCEMKVNVVWILYPAALRQLQWVFCATIRTSRAQLTYQNKHKLVGGIALIFITALL